MTLELLLSYKVENLILISKKFSIAFRGRERERARGKVKNLNFHFDTCSVCVKLIETACKVWRAGNDFLEWETVHFEFMKMRSRKIEYCGASGFGCLMKMKMRGEKSIQF